MDAGTSKKVQKVRDEFRLVCYKSLMKDSLAVEESHIGPFQVALLILSIALLLALGAENLWALPKEISNLIQTTDIAVCVLLLIDFFVRFHRAKNKQAFLKWGWIDLIASIPNLDVLRWGRLVRVLKIIRLLRAIRSVHRVVQMLFQNKTESGASALGLTAFLLVVFSSISILVVEKHTDANIKTAEDAIWWSVSTVTTVGYGDKYPVTTEGRIVCMILMVAGVGMFAGLSGLIASHFLGARGKNSSETMEMLARLETLQAKMEALIQNQTDKSQRNNTG